MTGPVQPAAGPAPARHRDVTHALNSSPGESQELLATLHGLLDERSP